MSEEINTEELETVVEESLTEEKSLEDQIAALEEVASQIETEVEEKAVEDETEVKSEDDGEAAEEGAEEDVEVEAEDETEEKGLGEADHSEEDCKDASCKWHGVDAKEAEESDGEEKAHPVATGYPYDAVVLQPGDPEFDEEEDEKTQVPKKRQIVVVEMDPEEVTDDMKAYVVEVDDDENDEEVPTLDDEEKPYHEGDEKRRVRVPMPDDDEALPGPPPAPTAMAPPPPDAPPSPAPPAAPPRPAVPPAAAAPDGPPQANPRLARLLEQARNGPSPDGPSFGPPDGPPPGPPDDDEDEAPRRRFRPATMVGKKEDEPASVKDLLDKDALISRMQRLGLTKREVSELGDDDFLCAIERKVLSGDVCNFCRGGCASEKGLPGLLEIEVMAEKEFEGHVVDSGYAPKDDIFVLDLKTDRGPIETYYSGAGATLGWIALAESIEEKSADNEGVHIVSFAEAEMIALQHCKGESLGVDADLFQGEDAYVVEINGKDGKSYDAYVSVDGNFLGTDMIELTDEEEEEIKELMLEKAALEAEVRIKRVYTTEKATELVDQGMALTGGRFPIVTHEDLENAILAAGRVKDDNEVREHIAKRAEEMEKTDLLPEDWDGKSAVEEAEFVASLMELQMLEAEFPADEKRVYTDETRQEYAERGVAMEDGSYPIRDVGDLKNAIQAFGRSKNPDATKRHIKKRARALGATDLLPDNWE